MTLGETVSQEGFRDARSTWQAICATNRGSVRPSRSWLSRKIASRPCRSEAVGKRPSRWFAWRRLPVRTVGSRQIAFAAAVCPRRTAPRSKLATARIVRPPQFVADLTEAQSRQGQAEFEAEYVALDLLILEDLAGIQGRMSAQRMLVVLMDELKRTGGRMIVTCTSLPGQLKNVIPRLVSRLRGGLCVPLELLDESSRHSFARHFAASRQIPLPPQAAQLLAQKGLTTPRELLAALINFDFGVRRKQHQPGSRLERSFDWLSRRRAGSFAGIDCQNGRQFLRPSRQSAAFVGPSETVGAGPPGGHVAVARIQPEIGRGNCSFLWAEQPYDGRPCMPPNARAVSGRPDFGSRYRADSPNPAPQWPVN